MRQGHKRVTVIFDWELFEWLVRIAGRDGRPVTNMIRRLVREAKEQEQAAVGEPTQSEEASGEMGPQSEGEE